jgi:hypothetical protein
MIPEFTDAGFLPVGIHRATIDEFKRRFAKFDRSDRRVRLYERLAVLFSDAKQSSVVRRIVFGGSFVSSSPEPNDFDCILVLDPAILHADLRPREYNLVSRHAARRIYGGDVIPAIDDSSAHLEYLEFFQTTRDGQKVGILEIDL